MIRRASRAARRACCAGAAFGVIAGTGGCGGTNESARATSPDPGPVTREPDAATATATTASTSPASTQTVEFTATDASPHRIAPTVNATVETTPVPHDGDAADDPAIWVDGARPARSLIIGTDKKGGIGVYDLRGRQLQYVADGEMNNVDLRTVGTGRRRVTVVAATNRSNDTIALYQLDTARRRLTNVAARSIATGFPVYGMCMYRSPRRNATFVFVGGEDDGVFEQWQLTPAAAGRFDARRVRTIRVGSKAEGCAADDATGALYIAEEGIGLWRFGADPDAGGTGVQVDRVGAGHLTADVEGVAIAGESGGRGVIVVSSQGSNTFAVYGRRRPNAYVGTFRIADGAIDGVEDTDGVDVTTTPLGPAFPDGLLVVQDGDNSPQHQNFKLVPWGQVRG